MIYYVNYFISLLFLLFVYSCSTEPIETGPFHDWYYCELNNVSFDSWSEYDFYCNSEGIQIYDSLIKENKYIAQFYHKTECLDSIKQSHYLDYNTITGYFHYMMSSEKLFFEFKRGNIYAFDKVGLFLSSEDYFLNPIRCRIVDYERDDGKRVVVNDVTDTIPSAFFTADPIETIDSASTCDELIAIFQSFYEICREWE